MDIVKKNLVSIIFGVIAIAAVVAAFYPMSGYFDGLNKKLAERRTKYDEAKAILDKTRELPVIKLEDNAERTPLTVFPMPVITKMAQGYMDKLVSQSRGVFEAAMQINRNECRLDFGNGPPILVLVQGALPEPHGNVENEFKRALTDHDNVYTDLR